MAKYIMVYKAGHPIDTSTLPKEQITQMMDAWGEYLGSMGSAVVDKGEAFKSGGKSVTSKGTKDADNLLGGYSIVEAKDIDEALSLAKNAPIISRGGSVEVYEAFGV